MSIIPSRVDGANVAVKIDQPAEVRGQNVAAQRCVKVNHESTLRLRIRLDSSHAPQSRIGTELWIGTGWVEIWKYEPRDFASVPNAYAPKGREPVDEMIAVMYDQMIADALLIIGGDSE